MGGIHLKSAAGTTTCLPPAAAVAAIPCAVRRAVLAVLQIPWVLHAMATGAARSHHALLERRKPAVRGAALVEILDTPRSIGLGGGRLQIEREQQNRYRQSHPDSTPAPRFPSLGL